MTEVEKYPLLARFERSVVYLVCSRPEFHGRIGHAIDPQALNLVPAILAVEAAQSIAKEAGRGPSDVLQVLQRLRRIQHDGKVTATQLDAVADLFDAAEDEGVMVVESVVAELTPILRRRVQQQVVRSAMDEYGKRGDFSKVVSLLNKAQTMGQADTSNGILLQGTNFGAIDALRTIDRLPTGISELDDALGGGLGRGEEGVFIGGPGGGKSMTLSHLTAYAMLNGVRCCYATAELAEGIAFARIVAAATGTPINDIIENRGPGREKFVAMPVGACWVKYFTPQVTTVADVRAWVESCEQQQGEEVALVVVDYADKLVDTAKQKDQANTYKAMDVVYEGLRIFAEQRRKWLWTASQSAFKGRRGKEKQKSIDLEDVADSSNKVRVADKVVTVNPSEDQTECSFFVAKNRTGRARVKAGPLPCDFERGLVAPMAAPFNPQVIAEELVRSHEPMAIPDSEEPF